MGAKSAERSARPCSEDGDASAVTTVPLGSWVQGGACCVTSTRHPSESPHHAP